MKHTIIIIALVTMVICTGAKTIIDRSMYSSRTNTSQTLDRLAISLRDDRVAFEELPANSIDYYIVGTNHRIATLGKLNRTHTYINMAALPPGSYSIILKRGSSMRAFGYCTAVVVRCH